jgi:hypothetical protein
MRGKWRNGLIRFILWDYPRASWQYDIMVGLILAFIFLTPRGFFRDQPRPKTVVMVRGDNGANVFWIDPGLLADVPEAQRIERAAALIRTQSGAKRQTLVRLEPIFDAEEEIKGYMAICKP